jgi:beta-N-acetylhexosaminidase
MSSIGAFISGCAGLSLTDEERSFFGRTRPWGLILFRRNCLAPDQIKALASDFRAAVGRKSAPVFVDQEGGRVQRLGPPSNAWRRYPPARAYGDLYASAPVAALRAARHIGRLMAADLTDAGITADCVPVLDVPQADAHDIIGDRAYSSDAQSIMALARAHVAGFLEGGVLPVMKHVPGHGRARADSHQALPVVEASFAELAATDFPPFAAFADLPMAMTAHVVYAAVDGDNPATLSKTVISKIIRDLIGFGGLLMTDDLSMKALAGSFASRTRLALEAGCDLVLHCNGNLAEMEEVASAAGPLKGASLRRARTALRYAGRPQPFDRQVALRELDSLVTG